MRAFFLGFALLASPSAFAQIAEPISEVLPPQLEPTMSMDAAFTEAANLCLARLLGEDDSNARFDSGLKPASDAARAGHPFGADPNLRESVLHTVGTVTVRDDDSSCSVFAVGAPPVATFQFFAEALRNRGGFTEQQSRRRPQEGRVQRTFHQDGGRVRIELEGFVGGMEAFSGGGDLAMAHIGRR